MDNLKNNFGKRKVSSINKTFLVQDVFSNVAKNYDLMNDFMSIGTHRLWKKELINYMNIQPKDIIVDVGSGTGDLIKLILEKKNINKIYSVDPNYEMQQYAKKKINHSSAKFIKSNAENLPFKDNYFDKYIISFCLRNVTDINMTISEAFRVLKPGGEFYCLEFSKPESKFIELIYKKYKKNIIPWMGEKISKNKLAYRYLDESIDLFPEQDNLRNYFSSGGFKRIKYLNLFNGIVALHSGYKVL